MMHRSAVRSLTGVAVMLSGLAGGAGCQEHAVRPVRVGVTTFELVGPRLLPRWFSLSIDFGVRLGRPLQFEVLTPHQIGVHLATGRLSFAMLDAAEYAHFVREENDLVLATAINPRGATERTGLILTSVNSAVESLAAMRDKRFDFLPKKDPLNAAALAALRAAGVGPDEIGKDRLLGYYHHLNSLEVAKAVAYEGAAGGIVDEAEYQTWPERGGTVLLGLVSRDQFRIVERIEAVPEMAVLASKRADAALVAAARKYFLEEVNARRLTVLDWMGVRGFAEGQRDRYARFAERIEALGVTEDPGRNEVSPAGGEAIRGGDSQPSSG